MVRRSSHMPPYQTVMEFTFVFLHHSSEFNSNRSKTLNFKASLSIDEKKCQEFLKFVDKLYDCTEFLQVSAFGNQNA